MSWLSKEELEQVLPAETSAFPSPIPTQVVSSDEYLPSPQSEKQREYEARVKAYGSEMAQKLGITRRRFFKTAAGMAASFLAMNDTWGPVFGVSRAEAQTPEQAAERARALSNQFIMDVHTHFLRPTTRLKGFVNMRQSVGKGGWNPALAGKEQTLDDLMFANWFKEMYLDSDTKIALVSGAPSDLPEDWFLTNEMKFEARARINTLTGSRRAMTHAIFTPGQPGWMEQVEKALVELKPDSMKGYTIGDNTNKHLANYPWRLDDEKLMYPFYERILKAGVNTVCVHKGLFPPSVEQQYPHLLPYCDVRDLGKAARDWPNINFVVYHSAYRWAGGGNAPQALAQFEQTGRVAWTSDLAEIPQKFGVSNVYGDLGQIFAQTTVAEPRLCAALMGILVKGLGHDHVVWGTDAIWTGSPQWQIEALRRLEIPEDLQRKFGFAPLGPADGQVKRAIFGLNSAKMYRYDPRAELKADDALVAMKAEYEAEFARGGPGRSNLRYGYVARA